MDTLISQLDQKYAKYKKGLLDEEYKHSVYFMSDCAYEYFCITENQPKIKEVVEQDKKELEELKKEIITENELPEARKELIKNAEINSLSFCYGEVFRDMYLPMSKHKNTKKLLSAEEIIGDTHIVGEKLLNFERAFGVKIANLLRIPILKDSEAGVALVKIGYSFNQKQYPMYMEKIHSLLTQKLLEIHTKKPLTVENSKINIIIDSKKGIYQASNDKLSYKIDKISKRLKLIKYLAVKDNCRISELEGAMNQTKSSLITAIAGINKMFRKETGLVDDLVVHIDTGGYSLNKEIFVIEILE